MGGKTRPVGMVLGLAGAAMVGYAIFSVLSGAGCVGTDACAATDISGVWMIPVGIVLAMAGMFTGGGFLVFSALFLAIGAGALAVGFSGGMPDMPTFPWLFGGLFFLGGLAPLFGGLVLKRNMAAKQAMAEDLYRTGAKGIGTLTDVADTGITINDNPRVRLTMRIEPLDGSAPVERHKTITASRVAIPRAGERFPVWFDRADPDKWMFGTDMDATAPADVRDMFARARAGAPAAAQPGDGAVEELSRLSALWQTGALTDAEFAEAKARLLAQIGR